MFQNNEKVSPSQLASVIILTMVGTGILTLPRALADEVGTDGWLVILFSGAISMLLLYAMGYIVKKLPGKNYLEILSATLTKPVAYVLVFLFIIYSIVLNSFLIRIFGEVIKMFLLFYTPIEVIMFTMLLTSIYLVRRGIETLGRLAEFMLPIVIILNVPLFLLTLQGTDFSNLLPVFQTPIKDLVMAIPTALFSFLGYEIMLVFGVFMNKPNKAPRSGIWTIGIVTVFYLFLNAMVLSRFGVQQTTHLIWPTLSLFKTIEFPGLFIENVEVVVMTMWVFIVFMSVAPFYLSNVILIANFAGVKNHNLFALPLLPLIYFISLFPDSMAATYYYLDIIARYGATLVVIIVPLLVLIALLIRLRRKEEGNNA